MQGNGSTIPERSLVTTLLVDALNKLQPGELVPYAELNDAINDKVQNHYGNLSSAKRILLHEYKKAFITVRGEGIKRATEKEARAMLNCSMKRSRNIARRGVKQIQVLDLGRLSSTERSEVLGMSSVLSLMGKLSRRDSIKRISAECMRTERQLEIGETLQQFTSR